MATEIDPVYSQPPPRETNYNEQIDTYGASLPINEQLSAQKRKRMERNQEYNSIVSGLSNYNRDVTTLDGVDGSFNGNGAAASLPIDERTNELLRKRQERNQEYNSIVSGLSNYNRDVTTLDDDKNGNAAASLPIDERTTELLRKRRERNAEYNALISNARDAALPQTDARNETRDERNLYGGSLPIDDRVNIQKQKELERNAEYNALIKAKERPTERDVPVEDDATGASLRIPDRNAELKRQLEGRKQEYNEYLRQKRAASASRDRKDIYNDDKNDDYRERQRDQRSTQVLIKFEN